MWRVAIYNKGSMVYKASITEVYPAFLIASLVNEGESLAITGRHQSWTLKKVQGKLVSVAKKVAGTH